MNYLQDLKEDVDFVKSNLHSLYNWACYLEDGCKQHKGVIEEMMKKMGDKPEEVKDVRRIFDKRG